MLLLELLPGAVWKADSGGNVGRGGEDTGGSADEEMGVGETGRDAFLGEGNLGGVVTATGVGNTVDFLVFVSL